MEIGIHTELMIHDTIAMEAGIQDIIAIHDMHHTIVMEIGIHTELMIHDTIVMEAGLLGTYITIEAIHQIIIIVTENGKIPLSVTDTTVIEIGISSIIPTITLTIDTIAMEAGITTLQAIHDTAVIEIGTIGII